MLSSRVTTGMVQRNVLSDLNSLYSKMSKTESQAASGKQLTRPSDDPYAVSRAMNLRQSLDANTQYTSNIQDGEGWQSATETSLSGISDYVNRARDLVVQGATDTVDADARSSIADEIDQIINGVKETANAQYAGSYLMSGTATDAAPYTPGTDDTYKGNAAGLDPAIPGVLREIGPGVTISINSVGQELLGDGQTAGDGKLLDVLRTVSADLRSNNGTALNADIGKLDTNQNTLLAMRARNGARINRLDAASSRLGQIGEALTQQLSNTEDADYAKTMIDFNSQSTAYQAALRAGANIVQSSLMDFLH
jgi:flagellar hook-associated protein 3 FlgL